MSDPSTTTAVIDSFRLDSFPDEWVKKCWDEDFADTGSLPLYCEEQMNETDFLGDQLRSFQKILSAWLKKTEGNADQEGFWSVLVSTEVPHKNLVAVLAYLINNGLKVTANFTQRSSGVLAASVYIKLFVLPGSAAFKIYNPELFLQCCRLLSKLNAGTSGSVTAKRKRSISPSQSQRSSQRKGKGRGKAKSRSNNSSENPFGDDDDAEDVEIEELSPSEMKQLEGFFRSLLTDVLLVCEKYSLRQSESTAVQLLSILLSFAKAHSDGITEKMGQWSGSNCSLGMLAYKGVSFLCQPFHGHVSALVGQVFKILLDHILMMEDGKIFSSLNRPVLIVRQQALDLVRHMAVVLGDRCVSTIKTLIQNMSVKVPDKTEYRSHSAQAVAVLLDCLPDLEYAQTMEWIKKLSKYKKVGQRSFVVDLTALLLDKPERILSDVPEDNAQFATHKSMVCILLSRCSDVNAGVRSRALVAFSSCTKSNHSDVVGTIKDVITPVGPGPQRMPRRFMPTPRLHFVAGSNITPGGGDSEVNDTGERETEQTNEHGKSVTGSATVEAPSDVNTPVGPVATSSFANIPLTPGFNPYLPDSEGVVSMFHRRVLDTKVVVRKSALQALQNIVQFEAPSYKQNDLQVLQERCADPALSVRKQAVQSLSELLQSCPQDKAIQKAWIFGTLPQVMDRETTVQERCFDLLEEAILIKIKPLKANCANNGNEWDLLNVIADEPSGKLRRYLQKACQYWARTKKIKPAVVNAVQGHAGGPNDNAAWMFLAELSKIPVKIDHSLVIDHWKENADSLQGATNDVCGKWSNVLSVLGLTAKSIQPEVVGDLLDDLKGRLRQFSYPTTIIAGMVNCVSKLHSCTSGESSQRQMQAWGEELMVACDRYMSDVILSSQDKQDNSDIQLDEELMIKYVFTLGEVCQRCPSRIPKRAVLLVQSIVAAPCIGDSGQDGQPSDSQSLEQREDGSHDSSKSQSEQPRESHDSEGISQSQQGSSSQATQNSQGSTQPLSQFRGSTMTSRLRALGFITLGKLCLVDESLGKKTIAALSRELEECESAAVRNNIVIIMGDLTIRYTTLVDRYITNIAACLKDPSPLVRKNTLTILTRLLQEEYVKWKGVLFFRYITTLLDEVEEIRNLAEFCLEHLLLKKHPNMFFHPFVECIFHFNNYQSHTAYNKFKQTEREKEKFTLAGKAHASQRMVMYTFMLEHMTDEHRFKTADKLNKEVLSGVVDNIIPLDGNGLALLKDTLAVLSCKEMKLSTLRGRGPQDDDGGEGDLQAQAQAAVTAVAKKAFISQIVRRNVIENIVPVVIALKHMLEKMRSPLLRDLMAYLQELMKDYKNEVKDILSADKQLAEEINFDLRTFENQEAQRAQASRPATPQPATSSTNTPAPGPIAPGSRAASPAPSDTNRRASKAASPLVEAEKGPVIDERVLRETPEVVNSPVRKPQEVSSPRRASLTVKDALKKTMTRVEQLRQSGGLMSPNKKAASPKSKQHFTPSSRRDSAFSQSQGMSDENSSLRYTDEEDRAISTPTDKLYNITFAADQNITMMPPSPIPSMASVKTGGQLCVSPTVRHEKNGDRDVLHMTHPDKDDPKLQQWNITSPTVKASKGEKAAPNNDGTPTRKSHRASRVGLRTRRSKQTEL